VQETSKVLAESLCDSSADTFLGADPAFGSSRVESCDGAKISPGAGKIVSSADCELSANFGYIVKEERQ